MGGRAIRFIGRGEELGRLEAALIRTLGGEATYAAVGGTAGVGKSRLVQELGALAVAHGADVHTAACPPTLGGAPVPFCPFTGIARSIVRRNDARLLDELLGTARDALASILSELDGNPAKTFDPVEIAEAMLLLLTRIARTRPVVVLLDDMHRAGPTALDVLVLLVHELRDAKVLIISTHETDRAHDELLEVLSGLDRLAHVARWELAPLPEGSARALLHEVAGDLPDAVETEILRRADGLPLYLEELGLAREPEAVPASLRVGISRQLGRLDDAVGQMIRAAAIIGGPVDPELLGAAIGHVYLVPALRTALGTGLVTRSGPDSRDVVVRHPLIADAIVGDLVPGERSSIAARLVVALDGRPDVGPADPLERALLRARLLLATGDREAAVETYRAGADVGARRERVPRGRCGVPGSRGDGAAGYPRSSLGGGPAR